MKSAINLLNLLLFGHLYFFFLFGYFLSWYYEPPFAFLIKSIVTKKTWIEKETTTSRLKLKVTKSLVFRGK